MMQQVTQGFILKRCPTEERVTKGLYRPRNLGSLPMWNWHKQKTTFPCIPLSFPCLKEPTLSSLRADYYERALTNGVLSIQRGTEPGVMIYMLPLGNGRSKADSYHGWGTRFNTFWCCYGTGVIYMEYIQLFVSHEIDLLYFSLIFVITKIQILFLCSLNFMIGFLVSSGLTKSFSLLCHLVFLYWKLTKVLIDVIFSVAVIDRFSSCCPCRNWIILKVRRFHIFWRGRRFSWSLHYPIYIKLIWLEIRTNCAESKSWPCCFLGSFPSHDTDIFFRGGTGYI